MDPVSLQEESSAKITLFTLDSAISAKLVPLDVQKGSSLIDPVLRLFSSYAFFTRTYTHVEA